MDSAELKSGLTDLNLRLAEIREGIFDVSSKEKRLKVIEEDLAKEEVWSDLELSQKISKEKTALEKSLLSFKSVEEKVSLSDRFGLWIGFHNMSQDVYLEIVFAYCKEFNISLEQNILRSQALEWSITRGARSGRVAWQFIQDIASKQKVKIN